MESRQAAIFVFAILNLVCAQAPYGYNVPIVYRRSQFGNTGPISQLGALDQLNKGNWEHQNSGYTLQSINQPVNNGVKHFHRIHSLNNHLNARQILSNSRDKQGLRSYVTSDDNLRQGVLDQFNEKFWNNRYNVYNPEHINYSANVKNVQHKASGISNEKENGSGKELILDTSNGIKTVVNDQIRNHGSDFINLEYTNYQPQVHLEKIDRKSVISPSIPGYTFSSRKQINSLPNIRYEKKMTLLPWSHAQANGVKHTSRTMYRIRHSKQTNSLSAGRIQPNHQIFNPPHKQVQYQRTNIRHILKPEENHNLIEVTQNNKSAKFPQQYNIAKYKNVHPNENFVHVKTSNLDSRQKLNISLEHLLSARMNPDNTDSEIEVGGNNMKQPKYLQEYSISNINNDKPKENFLPIVDRDDSQQSNIALMHSLSAKVDADNTHSFIGVDQNNMKQPKYVQEYSITNFNNDQPKENFLPVVDSDRDDSHGVNVLHNMDSSGDANYFYDKINNEKALLELFKDHNRNTKVHGSTDDESVVTKFIIKHFTPEEIKALIVFAKTEEDKEKVHMVLRNYKVITHALLNFIHYSNPLNGYIENLKIISESKQPGSEDFISTLDGNLSGCKTRKMSDFKEDDNKSFGVTPLPELSERIPSILEDEAKPSSYEDAKDGDVTDDDDITFRVFDNNHGSGHVQKPNRDENVEQNDVQVPDRDESVELYDVRKPVRDEIFEEYNDRKPDRDEDVEQDKVLEPVRNENVEENDDKKSDIDEDGKRDNVQEPDGDENVEQDDDKKPDRDKDNKKDNVQEPDRDENVEQDEVEKSEDVEENDQKPDENIEQEDAQKPDEVIEKEDLREPNRDENVEPYSTNNEHIVVVDDTNESSGNARRSEALTTKETSDNINNVNQTQLELFIQNLRIHKQIEDAFCNQLNTDQAIDVMESILSTFIGDLLLKYDNKSILKLVEYSVNRNLNAKKDSQDCNEHGSTSFAL